MAIVKKPKPVQNKEPEQVPEIPGVDVEALIAKGGSVAKEETLPQKEKPKPEEEIRINLRLLPSILAQVDECVKSRSIKIPRHTWLLEAVMEKLEREKNQKN